MNKIYALVDPRTGAIRYIGITSKILKRRLSAHIAVAKAGEQTHRAAWIRNLLSQALTPAIVLLQETDDVAREAYWIAEYRAMGADLTNGTAGGEGLPNPSPETRQRISQAMKARMGTDASKEIIRQANRRREWSPESIERRREYMRARMSAPESRAHISELLKGRPKSAHTRKLIGDAARNRVVTDAARENIRRAARERGRDADREKRALQLFAEKGGMRRSHCEVPLGPRPRGLYAPRRGG